MFVTAWALATSAAAAAVPPVELPDCDGPLGVPELCQPCLGLVGPELCGDECPWPVSKACGMVQGVCTEDPAAEICEDLYILCDEGNLEHPACVLVVDNCRHLGTLPCKWFAVCPPSPEWGCGLVADLAAPVYVCADGLPEELCPCRDEEYPDPRCKPPEG